MTNRIQITACSFALAALPILSGCVSNASGPGPAGTTYTLGHLDGALAGTPQKVVEATEAVLKAQDIPITSKDSTGLDGKVVGRTALGTQIEITVRRQDDAHSTISIRVGTFGDAKISRDLFEKIKAKL